MSVNTPYNKKHKLSKKAGRSLTSEFQDLHGKSTSEDIAITSMNIGGYSLGEMVISISQSKQGVDSYKGYLGILGVDVISKFNIILDYSSSVLYLQANKNFEKPFKFPLTGFKFKKKENKIIIHSIEPRSSAYAKGIRIGDELLAINDISSSDIEVFRQALSKEGELVKLKLLNLEGEIVELELKLTRLL